ncbi:unnamed protein product [Phyllotreta striolata]|uniref:Dystrophin n=1 Tax=Phyllotreta striolata TaxID=444603 RepID=A0A9N9TGT5_PHYSR|nr:unnamed protein product [Phyllotreta striolata]
MDYDEWTKCEDENGFLYYFNKKTGVKDWEHPKFKQIKQTLDECNYVKYSKYRVALKIRALQKALYFDQVPLHFISGVFDKHKLGSNECCLQLESCEIESVLYDIYFATRKTHNSNLDIDLATELMLNFLYNIFDPHRKGKIQVFSIKILLILLSKCELKEMYKYIYSECSDHNDCITRPRLQGFLTKITSIMEYTHEESSFGQQVLTAAVENCFLHSPGFLGINEAMFMGWVDSNPKILSWIPVLHRIRIAESISHSVRCNSCKASPITGMCYKCTKCRRYFQCQTCFLSGYTSNSHASSHAMKEYCTMKSDSSIVDKMFRTFVCAIRCNENEKFSNTRMIEKSNVVINTDGEQCDVQPMCSPRSQLKLVINKLERQTSDLHRILASSSTKQKDILEYLREHTEHVSEQVDKLKMLNECMSTNGEETRRKSVRKKYSESTPALRKNKKPITNESTSLNMLSPIICDSKPHEYSYVESNRSSKLSQHYTLHDTAGLSSNESKTVYHIDDISTWMGGHPKDSTIAPETNSKKTKAFHNDLDEALAQLQQILANNVSLDDSLTSIDNSQLKSAMTEVEGMLTSFIDTVENSRPGSFRSKRTETITEL